MREKKEKVKKERKKGEKREWRKGGERELRPPIHISDCATDIFYM